MTILQNTDALLLGIASYRYFNAFKRPDVDYLLGYSGSYGGGHGGGSGFDFGNPASGHGGNPGKNGKTYDSEYIPAYLQNIPSLTGEGAKAYRPGGGSMTGSFGYGGGKHVEVGYANTGGGGGWYGGGTGFGPYGAGGGSSICITPELMTTDVIPVGYQIPYNYLYPTEKPLYITGVNEGNGKCKITSLFNGEFNFEYTGQVQEFTTPADDVYFIEIWGGAGDGEFEEMNDSGEYTDTGGYGGYVNAGYTLPAGVTLYIYIGQAGWGASGNANDRYRAWNGGGSSNLGYSAGGAGSDVRWARSQDPYDYDETYMSRFIVAGGGGGYGKPGGSGEGDLEDTFGTGGDMRREFGNEVGEIVPPKEKYYVNNSSIAEITMSYIAPIFNENLGMSVYDTKFDVKVDVEEYGEVTGKGVLKSGVNTVVVNVPLSPIIPVERKTALKIIEARLTCSLPIIVPPKAITIRIKTLVKPSDDVGTVPPTLNTRCFLFNEKPRLTDNALISFSPANNNTVVGDQLEVLDGIGIRKDVKLTDQHVVGELGITDDYGVIITQKPVNPDVGNILTITDDYGVTYGLVPSKPLVRERLNIKDDYKIKFSIDGKKPVVKEKMELKDLATIKTRLDIKQPKENDKITIKDSYKIKFD